MQHKPFRATAHAARMLLRNRKSYALLSVTIILSFSVLLCYLSFVDSKTYNDYKEVFAVPRNVVLAEKQGDRAVFDAFVTMAKDTGAEVCTYLSASTKLTQYGEISSCITFLPEGNRPVYRAIPRRYNLPESVTPIYGCTEMSLHGNEAVINENFYRTLGSPQVFPFALDVPFHWANGSFTSFHLSVVGVCPDTTFEEEAFRRNAQGIMCGSAQIYTTLRVLGTHTSADMGLPTYTAWLCSDQPQKIVAFADKLDLTVAAACRAQSEATAEIRTQKATKALLSIGLLLLLGINLYSSFANALSERKFEIGVKRALGASAWSIVFQFLTEGILVMTANLLISVGVSADILIGYKIYQKIAKDTQWTIILSGDSAAMFLTCAVSLTLVFSLVFAYRSTKVLIAKHLRAE